MSEEAEELRAAIREMHEAVQDARLAKRELERYVSEVRKEFSSMFDAHAAVLIQAGLDDYKAHLDAAIEKATTATFKRFDTLADLLLGEGWRNQKKGKQSVREMFEAAAAKATRSA